MYNYIHQVSFNSDNFYHMCKFVVPFFAGVVFGTTDTGRQVVVGAYEKVKSTLNLNTPLTRKIDDEIKTITIPVPSAPPTIQVTPPTNNNNKE